MQCAGEVYPEDCFNRMKADTNTILLDVRTKPEHQFAGVADVSCIERKMICVEWQVYPSMSVNDEFVNQVREAGLQANLNEKTEIYCICRSGVRGLKAAERLTDAGFENSFNVKSGFEGKSNELGQRGKIDGWIADKLPWRHL